MNFYVLITQLQQLWIDIQSPPPPTESLQSSQNFGHSVGLPRDLWAPGKQRLRLVHVGAQLHLGLAHFKGHQGGWTESVRGGKATIVFWAPTLVREVPHASCPYEHRDIILILRTRKWTHRLWHTRLTEQQSEQKGKSYRRTQRPGCISVSYWMKLYRNDYGCCVSMYKRFILRHNYSMALAMR